MTRTEFVFRIAGLMALAWSAGNWGTSVAQAQNSIRHQFSAADDVPGTVAFHSLLTNPQWLGKTQPVKILLPEAAQLSVWNGTWIAAEYANPTLAATMGPVYPLRIAGRFRTVEFELYPTLELVSCLNPPADLQLRFPVLIAISEQDIEQVRNGQLLTKVIYLENPETALPYRQLAGVQPFFDVTESEDPLHVAARLGRPMAILRVGTRQPNAEELMSAAGAQIPLTVFPPQAARDLDLRVQQIGYRELETNPRSAQQETRRTPAQPAGFKLSPTDVGTTPQPSMSGSADFLPRQAGALAPQLDGTPSTQGPPPCGLCPSPDSNNPEPFHRDEFLLDGGDRDLPAVVDHDWTVHGLDPEDTIGHFDTLEGRRMSVPSNRVAIYAPRFAAVRRISNLRYESKPLGTAGLSETLELNEASRNDQSTTTLQHLQPSTHATHLRARGFTDQTRGVLSDNVLQPRGASDRTRSQTHFRNQRYGGFANTEAARQELAAVAARSWEDDLGLQVTLQKSQAVIVREAAKPHQLVTVKTDDGDSQLKVLKQASAIAANPGDEIEFTIEFQNVGARKIGNVTLIDNLTTRLEFVEDSASCSLDAHFSHEQNQAGSLVLRWEIQQPMEVNQAGTIRFRCRVR